MSSITRRFNTTLITAVVFMIAILYFFPILYMFLSSFKTEAQAVSPALFFKPTLNTLFKVLGNRNMLGYLKNSLIQVSTGTFLSLVLSIPAAFVLAFGNFKKRKRRNGFMCGLSQRFFCRRWPLSFPSTRGFRNSALWAHRSG